jgi:hypothetical protein
MRASASRRGSDACALSIVRRVTLTFILAHTEHGLRYSHMACDSCMQTWHADRHDWLDRRSTDEWVRCKF